MPLGRRGASSVTRCLPRQAGGLTQEHLRRSIFEPQLLAQKRAREEKAQQLQALFEPAEANGSPGDAQDMAAARLPAPANHGARSARCRRAPSVIAAAWQQTSAAAADDNQQQASAAAPAADANQQQASAAAAVNDNQVAEAQHGSAGLTGTEGVITAAAAAAAVQETEPQLPGKRVRKKRKRIGEER